MPDNLKGQSEHNEETDVGIDIAQGFQESLLHVSSKDLQNWDIWDMHKKFCSRCNSLLAPLQLQQLNCNTIILCWSESTEAWYILSTSCIQMSTEHCNSHPE